MFKILAGIFLILVAVDASGAQDFYLIPGIALVAAGLDTMFFSKK